MARRLFPAKTRPRSGISRRALRFRAAGVQQYEISNFARPGHRSRHNLKYWQRQPYIGFGLDAHSMLPAGRGRRAVCEHQRSGRIPRQRRADSVPSARICVERRRPEFDIIGHDEAFEESLFLGLRLNEGVDLNHLRDQFGDALLDDAMPALLEVQDAGLLELDSDSDAADPAWPPGLERSLQPLVDPLGGIKN